MAYKRKTKSKKTWKKGERRVEYNERSVEAFCAVLRAGGTIKRATDAAGIVRRTAYDWREAHPEFAKLWDDAYEDGTDVIEEAAITRATEGYERPIYQKGELVGSEQVYSDSMAALMLKGRRPHKYRDSVEVSGDPNRPLKRELIVKFV